jgi:hypothetical protein
MARPEHLFAPSSDGALYDTRVENWSKLPPLRPVFEKTFGVIHNAAELKATLRAGGFAWPGGYPMYFVMADGEAISFKTARAELRQLLSAFANPSPHDSWRVYACEINYEDGDLYDAHTNERIESAYAEDKEEDAA